MSVRIACSLLSPFKMQIVNENFSPNVRGICASVQCFCGEVKFVSKVRQFVRFRIGSIRQEMDSFCSLLGIV